MRRIIMLIVFLSAFGTLLAQTQHNNPVPSTGNFTANVIKPLLFTNISGGNTSLPLEVIDNQTRTFNPGEMIKLWKMEKEAKKDVQVWIQCDDEVDGLKITARWYWFDQEPEWQGYLPTPNTPLDPASTWLWVETDPNDPVGTYEGWIGVEITEIDATHGDVEPGTYTFTASIRGKYINL
jgi:hypothetical protein